MSSGEWSAAIEQLAELQRQAANAEGIKCGDFEKQIVALEFQIEKMCDRAKVCECDEARQALNAARDIAIVEALAPLRSRELVMLLDKTIDWLSRVRPVASIASP